VTAPLLAVENLAVRFATDAGDVPAVRGVSFCIGEGETVALVGESGCGKSVTALAIMRLIRDPGRIAQGRVCMRGRDLAALSETEMQRIRGDEIGMVFQEPMTSLNPVFKIGDQIGEVLTLHQGMDTHQARQEVVRLLEMVGIPSPARRVEQYPHELSGGMKQRVMIAMALACRPALLIADEPTTALDVTIQAQILELLAALQRELNMAILLITHNLGVVAHFAERAAVMYAGRIIEEASVWELFGRPLHPYTRALLRSLPTAAGPHARLEAIAGNVPLPLHLPDGCGFSTRCPEVIERCHREDPALEPVEDAHLAACWIDEQGVPK
jgi:oligopeptide/dipeptide ABC transporter ATP-binding protein